ncbi:SGNH/GDSL hydrolase family protein [Bacillus testis]|uniref:SGNH/GDSL hydrolase family protein n=1 Tax=Bacillus testis TaxID=1622072 RepID=UPI00067F13E2|nr:GDSL-type esterase/lipase family protein [Bacillus testis]
MKIICFGDSLTRGVSFAKGRLRILKKNYPAILQNIFSRGGHDIEVINKGVFNDDSDKLLERVDKDVIELKPDLVIIGIGGNDCNFRWKEVAKDPEGIHHPIVPIDRYIENAKKLVAILKEKNIVPVFLTLPPLDPARYYQYLTTQFGSALGHWISRIGGIEHWHGLYNRALNKWTEKEGVLKVDVRNAIKQSGEISDLISDDGIHLTEEGYRALSTMLAEALVPIIASREIDYHTI